MLILMRTVCWIHFLVILFIMHTLYKFMQNYLHNIEQIDKGTDSRQKPCKLGWSRTSIYFKSYFYLFKILSCEKSK